MGIKTFRTIISRTYIIEADEKAYDEYVALEALSKFNHELQFGLITANVDDFNIKIIKENEI